MTMAGTAAPLWYSRLDGNGVAVVGTNGLVSGAPLPAEDRGGRAAEAVYFDGADDFYSLGQLGTLAAGSMSAWVRLESLDDNQGVVAAGAYGGGSQVYFSLQADVQGGSTFWRCDLDDGASRRDAFSDSVVALDTWQHLAVTFAGNGTLRMYVNGVAQTDVQSLSGDRDPYTITAAGLVGSAAGASRALEGCIDDVCIWDEEIPAGRIALIHGFGKFHGLALDAPEIGAGLALDTIGETVTVDATTWAYADALAGPTGTAGGTVAGQDAFIVLDGNSGEGLQILAGPVAPPTIVNLPVSNITTFSAEVGGEVTDTGNAPPQVTLYYGTADGGTNAGGWAFGVALGRQSGVFAVALDTLAFGTEYFYRCYAVNGAGDAWAPATASFTTEAVTAPVLGAVSIVDITGTSAGVEGSVADTGGYAPRITIHYGTADGGTNPATWTSAIDIGGRPGDFATALSALQPDTQYFVAVQATNPAGVAWTDPSLSFSTLDASPVWINEFMAANSTTPVPNAVTGRFDDWVELHNAGDTRFDLGGWHLTDDPFRPAQWTFPAGAGIAAGGYLVVFASGDGAPDTNGNLHTSFRLDADGEYIGLFRPNLTVASEFDPGGADYPDQDPDVSYGLSPLDARHVYFEAPTPGGPNDPGGFLPVADTRFSPDRGFYDHPISVVITSRTAGAQIHYTTDGAPPTTNSTLYSAPIAVNRTTIIRARAYKAGLRETDVDTHTYILMDTNVLDPGGLNDVLIQTKPPGYPDMLKPPGGPAGDYDMDTNITLSATYETRLLAGLRDIPSVSVALPQNAFFGPTNGIYTHPTQRGIAWERACSAELLSGDDGNSWQVDCGIRVQGGASRRNVLKHSLSLRFREIYGPTRLRETLFPESDVREFNVIALRAVYNNSWIHWNSGQRNRGSMIRDQWVRDAMLDMGNTAAGNGFLVHLYVNGLYWGVHNLCERQDAAHYATHNGGDDETLFARNGSQWIDGNSTAADASWNVMTAAVSGGDWQAIQQVLDIDNYIDYQIVNRYGANADLKTAGNWRAAGGGPEQLPWQVYCWDSERVLESPTATTKPLDPVAIRDTLESQTEYVVRFGDRLHRHFFNQGALTPQRCADRWMERANALDRAIIGESARWGDYRRTPPFTRDAEWVTERNRLLTEYFPVRSQFVLDLYKSAGLYPALSAPTITPHGGRMSAGDEVVLTPAGSGDMVYTTDGSDPRLQGGAVNPTAAVSSGTVTTRLARTTVVRARTRQAGEWSALAEATFLLGTEDLRITEVMYHPVGETAEFVEIMNAGTGTVSLLGVHLVEGVTFDFMDGAVTLLTPGERVLVVRDESAFTNRYGAGLPVAGAYQGQLDDDGETVELLDALGTSVVAFAYNDGPGWPLSPDGAGHALVPADPAATQQDEWLSYGGHWRAGSFMGGSPGAPDPAPLRDMVINEVQAHTDYPGPWFSNDALELFNTTPSTITLNRWYLSDSVKELDKWPVTTNTMIAGSGWIAFDEVHDFNNPPGAGFGLSKGGEPLYVSHLPGNGRDRVADCLRYRGLENSVSWGRYPDGADAWYAMPETLGRTNVLAIRQDVRITEIMYHPPPTVAHPEDNTFHEYIELANATTATIVLGNATGAWRLDGGVAFSFPPATALASGEELLVVSFDPAIASNRLDFLAAYGLAGGEVRLLGPYAGRLSNRGDRITLERPQAPDTAEDPVSWVVVDEVIYFDRGDWPASADGAGSSLHRSSVMASGSQPGNWASGAPSPGTGRTIAPPLLSLSAAPGAMTLRWDGPSSVLYSVEWVDTLLDTNWKPLTVGAGDSPAAVIDTQSVDRVKRFYRLRVLP
jgi:hypothetical protein